MLAVLLVANVVARAAIPPPSAADSSSPLVEAQELAGKGQFENAEQIVRRFLGEHQDSAEAHFLLGYLLFSQKHPQESLAEYTAGARYRAPEAFDLRVVGSDYIELGDYEDADKWLSKATEWEPNNLLGWYYLGRTKYNENRFAEAVAAFRRCLGIDPRNVKAQDNLGLALQGMADYDTAKQAFQIAIDWQKDALQKDVGPYVDLGGLLLETDHVPEAIPYLQKAVTIAPDNAKAHGSLGKAYLSQNRLDQAEAELQRAAELAPDSASAHYVLGQLYRREGKEDQAKRELALYSKLNAQKNKKVSVPTPAH